MWQDLLKDIPRPLVIATVAYVAASWLVTGPLVAERTAEMRFHPACVAGLKAEPLPKRPGEQLLDELRKSPLFDDPLMRSLGLDRYLHLAKPQNGARGAAPRSDPDATCRCLIDQAIARSQTAWALYAGSLRLIARPEVTRFDSLIARISQEGTCHE
jgi:hypothetical protein